MRGGEHHVVLGQEPIVRVDQGGPKPIDEPAAASLGLVREGITVDQRLAGGDELRPPARERAPQRERDHPVVEQLESGCEPADSPGLDRAALEEQRRLLVHCTYAGVAGFGARRAATGAPPTSAGTAERSMACATSNR